MTDIFISYSHRDHAFVDRLEAVLADAGFSVFRDTMLHLGPQWDREIEEALDRAKCVLVVWSKDSVASDEVLNEAFHAQKAGKLIPLKIDDAKLPYHYARSNYLELTGKGRELDEQAIVRLQDEVRRRIGSGTGSERKAKAAARTDEHRLKQLKSEIAAAKRELKDAQFAGAVLDVRPLIERDVRFALAHGGFDYTVAKREIEARYRGARPEYLQMALVALDREWDRNRAK
ncbi:MAG: toll/interleukin-1 receptor domain-containing protein [Rhodocyclaceae bacterium]|nr:toll/interleukin-1 receptor domain-containing protein [Rhodocyclaceae bacterium]